MKSNKVLAGLLTVTFLLLSTITTFAAPPAEVAANYGVAELNEVIPISAPVKEAVKSYYGSFSGEVKEITVREDKVDSKFLAVENQAGEKAHIIIAKDTFIINNREITVGSVVTGYFDANAPRIMIYPPQYYAEVLVIESQEQNVKVDIFNSDLISSDNSLKLNIAEETEVISQDGKAFTGEIANRKLAVIYGSSTKSIPAQTEPSKIVVLSEKADSYPDNSSEDEKPMPADASAMDIVVNNKTIETPSPFINNEGTVMLPLRAIAEAQGNKVQWDNETQSIITGEEITIKIGQKAYTNVEGGQLQLETAPVLVESITFVPLSFFNQVTITDRAFVFSADTETNAEKKTAELLQQVSELARQGKVPGCEFTLKNFTIEEVEQVWGKADKTEYIAEAKGSFASYTDKGFVIGFNKGSQLFDIRSYDKELNIISQSDLEKVYGNPDMTRNYNGEDIIGYVMGDEFKIRFVFAEATAENPDPQLDHISVFYPQGTVNQMADDPGIEW